MGIMCVFNTVDLNFLGGFIFYMCEGEERECE